MRRSIGHGIETHGDENTNRFCSSALLGLVRIRGYIFKFGLGRLRQFGLGRLRQFGLGRLRQFGLVRMRNFGFARMRSFGFGEFLCQHINTRGQGKINFSDSKTTIKHNGLFARFLVDKII